MYNTFNQIQLINRSTANILRKSFMYFFFVDKQ